MSSSCDHTTESELKDVDPQHYSLLDFAQAARACRHTDQLGALCIEVYRKLGATMISYHHMPPPGASDHSDWVPVVTYGYPEDWVRTYKKKQYYKVDPIPRHALDACRPYRWSEVGNYRDLTEAEERFIETLKEANLGDGFAIAVFGPHGRNGYLGIGGGSRKAVAN
jgi:hypothetical protein